MFGFGDGLLLVESNGIGIELIGCSGWLAGHGQQTSDRSGRSGEKKKEGGRERGRMCSGGRGKSRG
jgi:hypothetical protein